MYVLFNPKKQVDDNRPNLTLQDFKQRIVLNRNRGGGGLSPQKSTGRLDKLKKKIGKGIEITTDLTAGVGI